MVSIAFYTPKDSPRLDVFGCASYGIAGLVAPGETGTKYFNIELDGIEISGTYEACLTEAARHSKDRRIRAAIVLIWQTTGQDQFVHQLSSILGCPVVGGVAAYDLDAAELNQPEKSASVLLVTDERYDIEVSCQNIHQQILSQHTLEFEGRHLLKVDGVDAYGWLSDQKNRHGFSEQDFEHLTFSDTNHINAHLRVENGKILSGRDLSRTMLWRLVRPEDVYEQIRSFYDDSNAIVFGCAGLRSILKEEINAPSLGLFMFGEVCSVNGQAEFGNLMLSKIKFITRKTI